MRPPSAADVDAARRALIARLRVTGAQGGRIDPHRAIATMPITRHDLAIAAALVLVATAGYILFVPVLAAAWTSLFAWLAPHLALGRDVATRTTSIASFVELSVPYFLAPARVPTRTDWWIALLVTVVVVALTLPMRARWLPLAYGARFAAAIQTTALVFFAAAPARFPYDVGGYVSGMMLVGAILIGVVPLVLGLTYYCIDVSWWRKLALTLAVMAHLAVLVPLQYALQTVAIVRGSLIVLPVCFILFGLLPEIMVLIALYGWGMSWESARARGHRQ